MYVYPPLLKKRYPTLDEARRALTLARAVDDRYRDVRPLKAILQALVENSPRLRGHQMVRRTAISSFDWSLVAHDKADVERAAKAEARLRPVIKEVMKHHTQRPLFGSFAYELNWIPMTANGTAPTILRRYRPVELERSGRDLAALNVLDDRPALPNRRAIHLEHPHMWLWGVDDEMPSQGGILEALIFHELLQNEGQVEWANFLRKLKGVVVALESPDASDEDRQAAAEGLRTVTLNNFVAMSKEIEIAFHKVVEASAGSNYQQFKEALAADVQIAILGQANTSELPDGGGSRAGLQVLNMIRADVHYADMVALEEIVNTLVLHDFQINSSPGALSAPWEFRLDIAQEQDVEKNARVVTYALEAGVPLKKSEVYERLGFEQPAEGDEVFTALAPAMPAVPPIDTGV